MKILASGDHHFDARSKRWEECLRIHEWIADLVEREQPDAFLSAGDIYERASTPVEREAVATWLTRIADVCPVVIAKGNHDARADVALMRRLKARHPVIVEEACGVHVIGGIAVAAVAWPSKASLLAMLGRDVDTAGADDAARAALQDVFRGLAAELDAKAAGLPRVLLTHAMVDGSRVSTGQPLYGMELRVGLEDLALARCPLVVCGHVHKPQDWSFGDVEVVYTGSPFRTAYGELETKSVLFAEWVDGNHACSRIPTPAQPMVLMEGYFADGELEVEAGFGVCGDLALVVPDPDIPGQPGADVRLRYSVAADEREAGRAAAAEKRAELVGTWGAARVTVEEVVEAKARARAPEITEATSTADKLRVLWTSRGEELGEREPRVMGRLGELEEAS